MAINPDRLPQISRRTVLKGLAAGALRMLLTSADTAVAQAPVVDEQQPLTPKAEYRLYLPEVLDFFDRQQEVFEGLRQYFPNLVEEKFLLLSQDEDEAPGIEKSVKAWRFWLDYMYPAYQSSLQKMAESGIPNTFFHNTVQEVTINLLGDSIGGQTGLDVDSEGKVVGVDVTSHYGNAEAIVGEYIHLLHENTDIEEGLTQVGVEGYSTLVHYNLMVWWIAINQHHLESGNRESAVTMPIIKLDGYLEHTPSVEQFNDIMLELLISLQELVSNKSRYLHTFTNIDEFGEHQRYQPGIHLLENYTGDQRDAEYQPTIEQVGLTITKEALPHVFTPEDTMLLAPFTIQGKDYPVDRYPENIQAAVKQLRERGLVLNGQEWQQLWEKFSKINVVDHRFALHPVVTARIESDASTDEVTIQAYQVGISEGNNHPGYQELRREDQPRATLHFQEPNLQGQQEWWKVDLDIERNLDGDTFIYYAKVPESVFIPAAVPRWVSLTDRRLVIGVHVDKILEVPMEYASNYFEMIGKFQAQAAEVRPVNEGPVAEPAEAPGTGEVKAATAVNTFDLPPEIAQALAKFQADIQAVDSSSNTFAPTGSVEAPVQVAGETAETPESEPTETVVFSNTPIDRKDEYEELKRRLEKALTELRKSK